jgi:hypothetical protein
MAMFFGWIWLATMLAGGFMTGSTPTVSTLLTANLTTAGTTVTVKSTTGFPATGVVVIGGEKIRYASKTATTFKGNAAQALERGYAGTDAVSHGIGSGVRSQEGALINNVLDIKLANIADSAGIMKFFAGVDAVFTMLATFFTAPLTFLGTDLAIITYLWGICAAGFILFLILTVTGGRRV